MGEVSLVQLISSRLVNQDTSLPVFNPVALKVQRMIHQDDYNGEELAEVIQQDQALTAYVMKVANSAFYAGLTPVKTVKEAGFRLGADHLVEVVHMITQKKLYQTRIKQFKALASRLWRHSLGSALAAKWLARNLGYQTVAEEAFMAGLLHDIGKLVQLRVLEELLIQRELKVKLSGNLIMEVMRYKHTDHGHQYLEMQNLPELYSTIVARHHDPDVSGKNLILNLVRLANATCAKIGMGLVHKPDMMLSTTREAINLMAKDLVLAELQVHLEDYLNSVDNQI